MQSHQAAYLPYRLSCGSSQLLGMGKVMANPFGFIFFGTLTFTSCLGSTSPLLSFLAPQTSTAASGGELGQPFIAANASACASKCLADSSCISFNTVERSGELLC
eukprot:4817845-Amphidinium_carterae.1